MDEAFLVLAGANDARNAAGNAAIVLAAEVASMNLIGCEFAVRPVCETGLVTLGAVGVLGL